MLENLDYNVDGSKCYDDNTDNCEKYGRLYDWETAKTSCPAGWHLPSADEWNMLENYIQTDKGCAGCDAKHLKATSGWNNDGKGLDSYGFAALPGGFGRSDGRFGDVGRYGYWWSASFEFEGSTNDVSYLAMYYSDESATVFNYSKTYLQSVRCIKD